MLEPEGYGLVSCACTPVPTTPRGGGAGVLHQALIHTSGPNAGPLGWPSTLFHCQRAALPPRGWRVASLLEPRLPLWATSGVAVPELSRTRGGAAGHYRCPAPHSPPA